MCEIYIVQNGYSYMDEGCMIANATCTIIKSPENIIVTDSLGPWDGAIIENKLQELGIEKSDITYVVSSHGHPDHCGNNYLFTSAKHHIVGFCMFNKDKYYIHPFEQGEEFIIDDYIKIIPTPGHTNEDISIVVNDTKIIMDDKGQQINLPTISAADDDREVNKSPLVTIISGDLFERETDIIESSSLWMGNSFNQKQQAKNRLKVLQMADIIIPGHGSVFMVQNKYVQAAKKICENFDNNINENDNNVITS